MFLFNLMLYEWEIKAQNMSACSIYRVDQLELPVSWWAGELPAPRLLLIRLLKCKQFFGFLWIDGKTEHTHTIRTSIELLFKLNFFRCWPFWLRQINNNKFWISREIHVGSVSNVSVSVAVPFDQYRSDADNERNMILPMDRRTNQYWIETTFTFHVWSFRFYCGGLSGNCVFFGFQFPLIEVTIAAQMPSLWSWISEMQPPLGRWEKTKMD